MNNVAKPVVLVVEDESMIADTLELTLTVRGYSVLGPVPTVAEALNLLHAQRPDAALIDYRLAKTTTEALLPLFKTKGIPVCVLTGYGRNQLPPAYAKLAILEKPFGADQLISTIDQIINESASRKPSA